MRRHMATSKLRVNLNSVYSYLANIYGHAKLVQ